MKQLPSEILGDIFLYLHPKNIVNLMLVCQHWKRVIEEFALFHSLDIRSAKSLNRLCSMFKANPAIRKKVEYLVISFSAADFDLTEFLSPLPNIRVILCNEPGWSNFILDDKILYPWGNHIEYINESVHSSIISSQFLSNICPNLTTVNSVYLNPNLISLLKNAPALKKLTLSSGFVNFRDLETLHENAPSLESFTFRRLSLHNSELSYPIKPAISVTECHFEEVVVSLEDSQETENLLTYASKKYPNVSKFTCTFFSRYPNDDNIKKLTSSDLPLFLQNLGPKLKKLHLCDYGWVDNTIDILDSSNFQIEYLKIQSISSTELMKLAQSQQIYYIQTLALYAIGFENFGWLNKLQTLKRLKIYSSSYVGCQVGIGLDDIMDNAPITLRSLSLSRIYLTADPKYIGLSNIERLSFDDVELFEGIDTFISQHFLRLTDLELKQCSMMGDTFDLKKIDLFNFTYQAEFSNSSTAKVLIITFNNNERRWYSLKKDNHLSFKTDNRYNAFYPSIKSRIQTETDTEPDFTLLCNSLKNCILIE